MFGVLGLGFIVILFGNETKIGTIRMVIAFVGKNHRIRVFSLNAECHGQKPMYEMPLTLKVWGSNFCIGVSGDVIIIISKQKFHRQMAIYQ